MNNQGYFIVDGSRLFASIHEIWRTKPNFKDKKLKLPVLTEALKRKWSIYTGSIIRVVYYFKKNDSRIRTMLDIPDETKPGSKDHWRIKECGESIESVPEDELQKLSPEYRDHFTRAEKGLDIRLTCDVLQFLVRGGAQNIVFLVNDRDYIPLFEAIHDLGGNVYLTALDSSQSIQKGLVKLSDSYLTLDTDLESIFGIEAIVTVPQQQTL